MIKLESNNNGNIIQLTDNHCNNKTITKIITIMNRLRLLQSDLIDWEILACKEKVYPDTHYWIEALREVIREYGEKYIEIHLLFVKKNNKE